MRSEAPSRTVRLIAAVEAAEMACGEQRHQKGSSAEWHDVGYVLQLELADAADEQVATGKIEAFQRTLALEDESPSSGGLPRVKRRGLPLKVTVGGATIKSR